MAAPIVFCVGLNRTGTTSFGDACEILGFSRRGWLAHRLCEAWLRGDIDMLRSEAEGFDVLEDLPWGLAYREMAEAFPDAKFVLTRRKSPRRWLRSQIAHTTGEEPYWVHSAIYGQPFAADAPKAYMEFYRRHLDDVRRYFAGTDRLLEVCWEEGDGWRELCPFLGVPVPSVPFPHSSPGPPWRLYRRNLRNARLRLPLGAQ